MAIDSTMKTVTEHIQFTLQAVLNAWEALRVVVIHLPPSEQRTRCLTYLEAVTACMDVKDLWQVQKTLRLIIGLLEGKMPIEVRQAIVVLEAEITSAWDAFTAIDWL